MHPFHGEDPFNNLVSDEVTFFGGPYVVFPGIVEESAFITQHLLRALVPPLSKNRSSAFLKAARALCGAALIVSDTIARRADLLRGTEPASRADKRVVIPGRLRLEHLASAVRFTEAELESALRRCRATPAVLGPLIIQQGAVELDAIDPLHGPLLGKPIVQCGSTFVVAMPSALLPALRHALISLAIDHRELERLASAYHKAVTASVVRSLRILGLGELSSRTVKLDNSDCSEIRMALDTDKHAHVLVISDDFTAYDTDDVFGHWTLDGYLDAAPQQLQTLEQNVFGASKPPNELLHLIVLQGIGRHSTAGLDGPVATAYSPLLLLTAADIETVAALEHSNPLVLWKSVRAAEEARKSITLMQISWLDEFGFYRSNDYSYYVSDDRRPTAIFLVPDYAGRLRCEARRTFDSHAALWISDDRYVEVVRAEEDSTIPVYMPIDEVLRRRPMLLVEGGPLAIWVTSREDLQDHSLTSIYFHMTDMLPIGCGSSTPILHQS